MSLAPGIATNMGVNLIGGGLIVLGIVLLVVTLVFWRSAVEDPAVLAPLEVMADRRFARASDVERIGMLDEHRVPGAAEVVHDVSVPVLSREPVSEPERPFRDPYGHDDDAVDVVGAPATIDPLLQPRLEED